MMTRNKGFTLIELMIVVAIIAILAAVAIPSYNDYVRRGKIAEATSALSDMRVRMEQYYQDNRTYQSNPVNGTACGPAMLTGLKYFSLTSTPCRALTPDTYTLTATGVDSMLGFAYTVDQANAKTSIITAPGWNNPNPNVCWALKSNGSC